MDNNQLEQSTRYKTFEVSDLDVKEGSREVTAVISSNSVDRDQEIVLPKGMNRKNFAGNPVVLLNHNRNELPIGKALWIKQDGERIIAKYKISEKTQRAQEVFGLLQEGILTSHSIGFLVNEQGPPTEKELRANAKWAGAKNVIRKWELLEFSVVGLPSNPDSIALSVAKGLSPEMLDFLGADQWQARKDCWQWSADSEPAQAKDLELLTVKEIAKAKIEAAYGVKIDPLEALNITPLAKWSDIKQQLSGMMQGMSTPDELIRKLKGQI